MTLLTDLDAFTREHVHCGELAGGVDEIAAGDWRVWFTCTCGARIVRSADDE
jgi:hypothetical protein